MEITDDIQKHDKEDDFCARLKCTVENSYFLASRSELTLTMQSNPNHLKSKTIIYTFLILSSCKGIELNLCWGFRIHEKHTEKPIYLRTKDTTHLRSIERDVQVS